MRDAFGGVFTMNLFLVFIFIYVAFTAVSLNYAKAFRVKNSIIDFVEQNEITDLEEFFGSNYETNNTNQQALAKILEDAGYYKECSNGNGKLQNLEGYCYNGIVIQKVDEKEIQGTSSKAIYYRVTTYADWNLGALNKLLALAGKREDSSPIVNGTWSINGEAKVVEKN